MSGHCAARGTAARTASRPGRKHMQVGWIGSRAFLRLMHQHAKDCGMFLSSHRRAARLPAACALQPGCSGCAWAGANADAGWDAWAWLAWHWRDAAALTPSITQLRRLLRKVEVDGRSLIVPDKAAPTDRSGRERWPAGWGPGQRVETQQDVFQLLGLPHREATERDA